MVPLSKPQKPSCIPSSYLYLSLSHYREDVGEGHIQQVTSACPFRRARLTVDTIAMVVDPARGASAVDKCWSVVLLDAKNAFDSVK